MSENESNTDKPAISAAEHVDRLRTWCEHVGEEPPHLDEKSAAYLLRTALRSVPDLESLLSRSPSELARTAESLAHTSRELAKMRYITGATDELPAVIVDGETVAGTFDLGEHRAVAARIFTGEATGCEVNDSHATLLAEVESLTAMLAGQKREIVRGFCGGPYDWEMPYETVEEAAEDSKDGSAYERLVTEWRQVAGD